MLTEPDGVMESLNPDGLDDHPPESKFIPEEPMLENTPEQEPIGEPPFTLLLRYTSPFCVLPEKLAECPCDFMLCSCLLKTPDFFDDFYFE